MSTAAQPAGAGAPQEAARPPGTHPPEEGEPTAGPPPQEPADGKQRPQKVLIWHRTGSGNGQGSSQQLAGPDGTRYVLIGVSLNALDAHLRHGDKAALDLIGGPNGGPDGIVDERDFEAQFYDGVTGADGQLFTYTASERQSELITTLRRSDVAVIGADSGGEPGVRVLDADTGAEIFRGNVFGDGFTGGVRVAAGDVTGDGWSDVIVGAGPGGGPHIRVFDGRTGEQVDGPLGSFLALDGAFTGGVFVASGDVNGDHFADVVVAADAGGIPDLVSCGETGVLYDPARPAQGIEAVRTLLDRPSMRSFYAQQGRKAARACAWPAETERLVDHYRRAIAINRQRGLLGRLQLAVLGA